MRRNYLLFIGALVATFNMAVHPTAANNTKTKVGPVTITVGAFEYSRAAFHGFGGVTADSSQYRLVASDIKVVFGTNGSATEATLVGNIPAGKQVTATITDAGGAVDTINADRAVYKPDDTRTQGGNIVFTGHVSMKVKYPKSLAEPAIMTVTSATVKLGISPEYPSISGENGQLVVTPL